MEPRPGYHQGHARGQQGIPRKSARRHQHERYGPTKDHHHHYQRTLNWCRDRLISVLSISPHCRNPVPFTSIFEVWTRAKVGRFVTSLPPSFLGSAPVSDDGRKTHTTIDRWLCIRLSFSLASALAREFCHYFATPVVDFDPSASAQTLVWSVRREREPRVVQFGASKDWSWVSGIYPPSAILGCCRASPLPPSFVLFAFALLLSIPALFFLPSQSIYTRVFVPYVVLISC